MNLGIFFNCLFTTLYFQDENCDALHYTSFKTEKHTFLLVALFQNQNHKVNIWTPKVLRLPINFFKTSKLEFIIFSNQEKKASACIFFFIISVIHAVKIPQIPHFFPCIHLFFLKKEKWLWWQQNYNQEKKKFENQYYPPQSCF